jgi:carbamoyl-phosphate synthase small subunit
MCGYQEIISDPAYTGQMVLMTYPLIGNYGITDEDYESKNPTCGGLIVREYNDNPSNFRYTKTLAETMEEYDIPGIAGFDTRELTRKIRDNGSCKVLITSADTPKEEAMKILAETELAKDLVAKVSCKKTWYARTANHKFNVVALDCGVRLSTVHALNSLGCNVTVVPYNTTAEAILKMKPDGVLVAGGPGNPEDVAFIAEELKKLAGKVPMLGTALGHELIGMAYGATTYKLKFGHHGGNHPVMNVETGKVITVSQSQDYTLDEESVKSTELKITHYDILDKTVEGVENAKDKAFGVQFNPEGAPGAVNEALFDKFITIMKEGE